MEIKGGQRYSEKYSIFSRFNSLNEVDGNNPEKPVSDTIVFDHSPSFHLENYRINGSENIFISMTTRPIICLNVG